MAQLLDLDDFPPGTLACTPSGRIGIVIKHQGAESKRDHFQRVLLHFGGGPRDSVLLQPHMMRPITPGMQASAMAPEARQFWASPEGTSLLEKLRDRQPLDRQERQVLERVMRGEPAHNQALQLEAA